MGNHQEHATRTPGKPHAGRGQLLSVSTLLLSNLDCKFLKKRPIMSSLHSTGHMWAPQVASAAAQPQGWVAGTQRNGERLQALGICHSWWHRGDVTLLVTQGRMWHSWWHRGGHVPRICSRVPPAKHLLQELPPACVGSPALPPLVLQVALGNWTKKTTCQIF